MGSEWIVGRLAGGGGVDLIQLAQNRELCEYGDEPSGSGATELDFFMLLLHLVLYSVNKPLLFYITVIIVFS
jgi:hypothetical protein